MQRPQGEGEGIPPTAVDPKLEPTPIIPPSDFVEDPDDEDEDDGITLEDEDDEDEL